MVKHSGRSISLLMKCVSYFVGIYIYIYITSKHMIGLLHKNFIHYKFERTRKSEETLALQDRISTSISRSPKFPLI